MDSGEARRELRSLADAVRTHGMDRRRFLQGVFAVSASMAGGRSGGLR